MKFNDFKYERPNIEEYIKNIEEQLLLINTNKDLQTEINAIKEIDRLDDELQSMITLAAIRNSINTTDLFYEKEQAFYDLELPNIRAVTSKLDDKLLESNHRKALEKEFGELLFLQTELSKKTFKPEIIEDLQLENKLSTDYNKLTASAKIEFDGGVYNLSQMSPFTQNTNRDIRKRASLAVSKFFNDNLNEFDRIYDEMVKVRTTIANKLGYDNFVQLGYDRMGRTDYNFEDVNNYRLQIMKDVVPYVNELTDKKAKRLNIDNPQSYDLALSFLSGNPTPKGDRAWQVEQAKAMYEKMSPETNEFFNFMLKHELLDLDSKQGKEGGGYCTFIPKYNAPFIFANFNGTSHDVDVLTHEAGHAFQVYESRNLMPAYRWPTNEAAEIHSMSMEFLAYPWIDTFFKEDTEKYKYDHLAGAVSFLPYGALVDHFQYEVYSNPNLKPEERRALWRSLEKSYLPFKKYEHDEFLENGGFWFRQGHIFGSPFYYIDYTLAQVCAFQFRNDSVVDFNKTWDNYLKLCRVGGSKSFVELVNYANLDNPFKDGTIHKVMKPIKEYLNGVEDNKL